MKVFEIIWSNVQKNANSDLETNFQVILTSDFFQIFILSIYKCLKSLLDREHLLLFQIFKLLKGFEIFCQKLNRMLILSRKQRLKRL